MLLAKAALGVGGALAVAGAYTFHEGVIRVDVDEYRAGGDHVHFWVPAALVPMAMHVVPKEHFHNCAAQGKEFLPLTHVLIKELKKYPDTVFVEVKDGAQHVVVRTQAGDCRLTWTTPMSPRMSACR